MGAGIAALAAIASWAAVVVAIRAAKDARETERDAARPRLLLVPAVNTSGPNAPTMTMSIHNAGGGIAQEVGLLVVTEGSFARYPIDLLRPGETVYFGSNMPAEENPRAVAYGRAANGEGFVWNTDNERRPLAAAPAPLPSWADGFAVFYPDIDVEAGRELRRLLRGDSTLF